MIGARVDAASCVPPAPRVAGRRRAAGEVLVRARALSLLATIAEGYPVDDVQPDVARFGLAAALTADDAAMFRGELEAGADASRAVEAAMMLAYERTRASAPPSVTGIGAYGGTLAFESVRWRRAGLVWATEAAARWPPP